MAPRRRLQANANYPEPTPGEFEILGVLWDLGPSTVRQIYAKRAADAPIAYTTVLSMLQIMHQKGLVRRDEKQRAHVYAAAISRHQAQRRLLGRLLKRVFGGSAIELVMQALGSDKPATPEDIKRIRERLDELEGRKK